MKYRTLFSCVLLLICIFTGCVVVSNLPVSNVEAQDEWPSVRGQKMLLRHTPVSISLCHHRYAAQPGIPFPCTPRVTRYNNLSEFFRWTAEDERRKTKLLAPVHAFCAEHYIDPFPSVNETVGKLRNTVSLAFIGCGSSRPQTGSGRLQWDYGDGVSVPENIFLSNGGNVLLSAVLITADEERDAGVGRSGQWHRCWVIPMTRKTYSEVGKKSVVKYEPTCQAGDLIDVRMESRTAKVAVDRVIDMDDGVLEVQFYIRKRDTYSFCADLLVPHQNMLAFLATQKFSHNHNLRHFGRLASSSLVGSHATLKNGIAGPEMPSSARTPAYPENIFCMISKDIPELQHDVQSENNTSHTFKLWEQLAVVFKDGFDVVPLPIRCDLVEDFDRFRFGAWYRVGDSCDGVHCVDLRLSAGTTPHPSLQAMEGWLWVSDICRMRLFTDEELLLSLFSDTWFLAWGPSTMREPLNDMLEVHLHTKIFKSFMKDIWKLPEKKKPGFFAFRLWDKCVEPSTLWSQELFNRTGKKKLSARVTLLWGGCLSISSHNCFKRQGLILFHERLNSFIGVAARRRNEGNLSKCGSPSFPTVLLLDHVVWRGEFRNDNPAFIARMRYLLMEQLPRLYEEVVNASPGDPDVAKWPLTIWHTGPAINNANLSERDMNYRRVREMHFQWEMEDELSAIYRVADSDSTLMQRTLVLKDGEHVKYIHNNNRYPPLTVKRILERHTSHGANLSTVLVPAIVLISRHQITLPLRFGNEFGRRGVHYGSTSGHCLTAHALSSVAYKNCVRKNWADRVLQIMWWNAMANSKQKRVDE